MYLRIFIALLAFFLSRTTLAYDITNLPNQVHLLAQADLPDDSYDPFADYSEFDSDNNEEADIHFFKNGRFATMGLLLGYRSFTGSMSRYYAPGGEFGLFLTFFFDLRFALQFSFTTGDHGITYHAPNANLTGNQSLTAISMAIKYYLNTQNMTRGLADLNPYMMIGLGNYTRTIVLSGIENAAHDAAMAFDGSLGIEVPVMRNKMFFGLQLGYHMVNFKDENQIIIINNVQYGYHDGDVYDVMGILGVNF